jgi:hypothetical protein
MSLLMMRRRFTVMVLKPNNSHHTERVLLHLAPRKHGTCAHEWKQCCLVRVCMCVCACVSLRLRHCALWMCSWRSGNQYVYLVVLRRLQDAVQRNRPEMWTVGSWLSNMIIHLLT